MKIRPLILALTVSLFSGLSVPSFADDTELFSGSVNVTDGSYYPNILFMMDNTLSMQRGIDSGNKPPDEGELSRLDSMKAALQSMLNALGNNTNVGIGNFAGPKVGNKLDGIFYENAPINYPVTSIGKTVEVTREDESVSLHVSSFVENNSDDAMENTSTKVVTLNDEELIFTKEGTIPYLCHRDGHTDASSYKTLVDVPYNEHADHINAGLDTYGPCLEDYFYKDKKKYVLIDNPENLYSGYGAGCQDNSNKTNVCHNTSSATNPYNLICVANSSVGTHVAEHSDSIAPNDATDDADCGAPDGVSEKEEFIVGLRFDLNIPQGATITSANLTLTSATDVSDLATITIKAENSSNPLTFLAENENISSRTTTTNNVTWDVGAWSADSTYETDDLSSVVQEVVDSSCSLNSLVFILEGSEDALQSIISKDGNSEKAPKLNLTFDTGTTPTNANCSNNSIYVTQVSASEDDAQENDGTVNLGNSSLSTKNNIIGVRFQELPIPTNATVVSAQLIFHASLDNENNKTLTIEGEKALSSAQFRTTTNDLSARAGTTASVDWETKNWYAGNAYRSPDLKNIIQEIINQNGWEAFNDLAFIITNNTSSQKTASSFDQNTFPPPILMIEIEGALAELPPRIVREELKEIVTKMELRWGTPITAALYESALYFTGKIPDFGRYTHKSQCGNECTLNILSHPKTYTGGTVDDSGEIITGTPKYTSPMTSICQPQHIVFLTDGQASFSDNRSPSVTKGSTTVTTLQATVVEGETNESTETKVLRLIDKNACDDEGTEFDENDAQKCAISVAKYLNTKRDYNIDANGDGVADTDDNGNLKTINTNIKLHTIAFALNNNNALEYLEAIAEAGGGDAYRAGSTSELVNVFQTIIANAMRDNATLASPGVSVNRFNQLYHSDNVYYSLFKPTSNLRWDGNFKKYRIEGMKLLDKDGNEAVENGAIKETARSFWSTAVDGTDIIEGGAGEQLMADLVDVTTTRQVYTVCDDTDPKNDTVRIVDDNTCTVDQLGVADEAERTKVVKWLLGEDVDNQYTDARYVDANDKKHRWAIADSLHSSLQAITYMPDNPHTANTNEEITKLFVGTNDGMVRMIDANTGKEDWAFVPNALINLPNTGTHTYGMDSTPIFWINDQGNNGIQPNSNNFVRMYIGMRRGGKNLYALDVTGSSISSLGTPPQQMWVIEGGEVDDVTGDDFTKLAQTWSAPKPVAVNPLYCDSSNPPAKCPVLLFGGGYDDTSQESLENGFGTSTTGNAIYMVHAETGKLLWWASNDNNGTTLGGDYLGLANMNYPIPSDLKVLDSTGNGWIDRIYFGNLGGQVWRIDIDQRDDSTPPQLKEIGGLVANLSDSSNLVDKRRFFFAPERYYLPNVGDVLTIVSGRRTHPMSDNTVHDRFYTLLDKGWELIVPNDSDSGTEIKTVTEADLEDMSDWEDTSTFDLSVNKKGWYIKLEGTGEKGTSEPAIGYRNGNPVVFFTTFMPPGQQTTNVCEFQEGSSRLYALSLLTAGPAFDKKQDGGEDTEEFNDGHSGGGGDHKNDRSITLKTPGMTPSVQIVNTETDGAFAMTGFETVDVDDQDPPSVTFWRQVDE